MWAVVRIAKKKRKEAEKKKEADSNFATPPTSSPSPPVQEWDPNRKGIESPAPSGFKPVRLVTPKAKRAESVEDTKPSGRISSESQGIKRETYSSGRITPSLPLYHTINGVTYIRVNGYQRVDVPSLYFANEQCGGYYGGYYEGGNNFGGYYDVNHDGHYYGWY